MYMAGSPVVPPRVAWKSKPTTYVICAEDRAIPPKHQRQMAKRANSVIEWQVGHSPFLNRPELVAELLVDRAR